MRTYTIKKAVKALQNEDNKKIIYYIPARGCGKGLTAIEEMYKYLKLGYKVVIL